MKSWSRKKDNNTCRLPLCTAVTRSIVWENVRHIFALNMPAIYKTNELTRSQVFLLAAIGEISDIESAYKLLRKYPSAIAWTENRLQNYCTVITRKRGADQIFS